MAEFTEPPDDRAAIATIFEQLQGLTFNDRISLLTKVMCLVVHNAGFPDDGGERLIAECLPEQYADTKMLLAKLAKEGGLAALMH